MKSRSSDLTEHGRIRFGAFDFDPETLELRRDGTPIRLQPQPAQVLAVLLARAGEVVSREELRKAIWGADTFVDFDRGLNFCIAQIRSALRDSADSPVYVKTLPRRGYQFTAPVALPVTPPPHAPVKRRRVITIVAVLSVTLLLLIVRPWHLLRQNAPNRIAVARFDNQTKDRDLDRFTDALTDAIIAELTSSGENRYAVIGNAAVLRQARNQRDLGAIRSALNADVIVIGQVQRDAGRIQTSAQLIRLSDQVHLKFIRIRTGEGDQLRAEDELAKRIVQDISAVLKDRNLTGLAIP